MDFKKYVNDNLNSKYKDILYNDKATPYQNTMVVYDYCTFRDRYRQYKKRLEDEKNTFNQAIDTAKQNKILIEREDKERRLQAQIQKEAKRKKRIKRTIVTIISLILIAAATFGVAYTMVPEFRNNVKSEIEYRKANSLIKDGEYAEAFSILADISEYEKAKDLLSNFTFIPRSMTHNYSVSLPVIGGYGYGNQYSSFGYVNTQTFDENGNLIKDSTRSTDRVYSTSGSYYISYSTEYSYDENGWLVSEKDVSRSGEETITEYKNTYDNNGNCVQVECIYPDGSSDTTYYTYDGKLYVKEVFVSSDNETTTTEYVYDEFERCTKKTVIDSDNIQKTWEYIYNAYGGCISTICSDAQGNVISTSEVEYSYSFSHEEGKLICTERTDNKTTKYLVVYSEK